VRQNGVRRGFFNIIKPLKPPVVGVNEPEGHVALCTGEARNFRVTW
jgi:hypothetical protein